MKKVIFMSLVLLTSHTLYLWPLPVKNESSEPTSGGSIREYAADFYTSG